MNEYYVEFKDIKLPDEFYDALIEGICCQRAAMLTILAIFESIYRQTNRTGGQYFKKICRCALPGRLEFGDSNERKSGARSGVKTGAISGGLKSGVKQRLFCLKDSFWNDRKNDFLSDMTRGKISLLPK